jgi:hypothetical protein
MYSCVFVRNMKSMVLFIIAGYHVRAIATNGDMAAWVATLIFRQRQRLARKICFGDPDFAKMRKGRQDDF